MNNPTSEQIKCADHIHALKAALDKARETGETLNLTIGKYKAVYQNGNIKLK